MSATVSNGGIGKSPAIDKLNKKIEDNEIILQMEDLVCAPNAAGRYPDISINFKNAADSKQEDDRPGLYWR